MIDKDKIAIVCTIKLNPVSPKTPNDKAEKKLPTRAQITTSFSFCLK